MFLCGSNYVGGETALAMTPTDLNNIDYVELKNGVYDDLYLSGAADFALDGPDSLAWNFHTALWAKFAGNTHAGNVDWSLQTTSHLALKRREQGEFAWKTISVKEVRTLEDFVINRPDYLATSGQPMEYAIVNVLNGAEGNYATVTVTPKFDKLFLIEGDTVWGTDITDGSCNTTRNIPSSTVELLNSKYPVFIRNTRANYDTGSCSGSFVPLADEEGCQLAYGKEHDYRRMHYQRAFMDFLADGRPKILKLPDGRLWLVQVTPSPADNARATYNDREISWNWVEIGDANSEEDLYYLGLSDVSSEWWGR